MLVFSSGDSRHKMKAVFHCQVSVLLSSRCSHEEKWGERGKGKVLMDVCARKLHGFSPFQFFLLSLLNICVTVNCWPSENGQGGCDVNIEYELEHEHMELNDVCITIPLP